MSSILGMLRCTPCIIRSAACFQAKPLLITSDSQSRADVKACTSGELYPHCQTIQGSLCLTGSFSHALFIEDVALHACQADVS